MNTFSLLAVGLHAAHLRGPEISTIARLLRLAGFAAVVAAILLSRPWKKPIERPTEFRPRAVVVLFLGLALLSVPLLAFLTISWKNAMPLGPLWPAEILQVFRPGWWLLPLLTPLGLGLVHLAARKSPPASRLRRFGLIVAAVPLGWLAYYAWKLAPYFDPTPILAAPNPVDAKRLAIFAFICLALATGGFWLQKGRTVRARGSIFASVFVVASLLAHPMPEKDSAASRRKGWNEPLDNGPPASPIELRATCRADGAHLMLQLVYDLGPGASINIDPSEEYMDFMEQGGFDSWAKRYPHLKRAYLLERRTRLNSEPRLMIYCPECERRVEADFEAFRKNRPAGAHEQAVRMRREEYNALQKEAGKTSPPPR